MLFPAFMTPAGRLAIIIAWLLLTGWFVLILTVLSFVVAVPSSVQPASETMIAVAALAFIVYNIAIKRWAIAVSLLMSFVAVMGRIVTR